MQTRERGSEDRYFCRRPLGTTSKKTSFCLVAPRVKGMMSTPFPDRRVQREQRPSALRVMRQIKKIGRTKATTQAEILCWRWTNRAHPAYSWRHGQSWGLLLVKVLNLFHTASQCALIFT